MLNLPTTVDFTQVVELDSHENEMHAYVKSSSSKREEQFDTILFFSPRVIYCL